MKLIFIKIKNSYDLKYFQIFCFRFTQVLLQRLLYRLAKGIVEDD